jgi:hypothetical protein
VQMPDLDAFGKHVGQKAKLLGHRLDIGLDR